MPEKPTYEELDLKNKDEKLREYKAYIDAMGDTLIVLNLERKVIKLNKAAIQLLGYTEEDIPHLSFETIFPEKEHEKHYAEMKIALDTETIRPFETLLLTKDGEEIPVLISGTVFKDARNEPIGFVGVCRDITERKRAEESLRKQTHDLDERVKELNCLYGISKIIESPDITFEEMLQEIVDLIPPSWQYPEITCARIIIEGQEYKTKNFKETVWKQTSNIVVHGKRIGILEICYIEEKPESDEGPFLKEERSLISAIAERLGRTTEHKQAEEALRENEGKLNTMLQSIGDHMSMMDKDLNIIWANKIAKEVFGTDIIGKKCYEVYHQRKEPCEPYPCITLKAFQDGKIHKHDTQVIDQDGKTIFFHCTSNVGLRDKDGKLTAVLEISRDITEKVRAERALRKAHDELERRVKERTRELEIKTNSLEEINTAMKVLLKKRKEDKTELESNVLTNVKELISPYFEKIKKTKLDDQQEAFLSIIESNLNEIISPFTRKMSLQYLNLTPTEIKIANLIRHGSATKKIAELMNISPRTVETHRKNIRRKVGLKAKRGNLRSHLLSLH